MIVNDDVLLKNIMKDFFLLKNTSYQVSLYYATMIQNIIFDSWKKKQCPYLSRNDDPVNANALFQEARDKVKEIETMLISKIQTMSEEGIISFSCFINGLILICSNKKISNSLDPLVGIIEHVEQTAKRAGYIDQNGLFVQLKQRKYLG